MASAQLDKALRDAQNQVSAPPHSGFETTPGSHRNLAALCEAYQKGPICLFTGAGVSLTKAKHYATPGWWDLLAEVHARLNPDLGRAALSGRFEEMRLAHPSAWDLATALVSQAGSEACFLAAMRQVLVGHAGRDSRYKRLPKAYLDHAATLNAVIAFCSSLRAVRVHPCLLPNPNIRAVLTLNYDWFLEGGATQKYNANRFKPIASSESREDPRRISVYHIHGYVPHGLHRQPKHPLILTKEAYLATYRPGTFTLKTLHGFLGRFVTLFIGVSFEDAFLVGELGKAAERGGAPSHFALLRQESSATERLQLLAGAGVRPILYGDHNQIPTLLGRVYCSGLADEDLSVPTESRTGKRVGWEHLRPEDYWRLLVFNKP